IFRRARGAGLPIESTLTLTDAVRKALMSNAGHGGPMPDLISGHGSGKHCALVALPYIGSGYGDGRLMGFAIVLPRGVSAAERRHVFVAAGLLEVRGVYLGSGL